jgi:hypothetical protein
MRSDMNEARDVALPESEVAAVSGPSAPSARYQRACMYVQPAGLEPFDKIPHVATEFCQISNLSCKIGAGALVLGHTAPTRPMKRLRTCQAYLEILRLLASGEV